MGDSERSARSLPTRLVSPIKRGFPLVSSTSAREEGRSSPQKRRFGDVDFYSSGFQHAEAGPSTSSRSRSGPRFPSDHPAQPPPSKFALARSQLAPPPLAPYVNPDRRYFAPKPAQEQWLGPDGRRSSSQERPAIAPMLRPPPPHIVAALASSSKETAVPPPPHFQSRFQSSAGPSTYNAFPPPLPATTESTRLLPTPPDSRGSGFPPPPLSRIPLAVTHPHPQPYPHPPPHTERSTSLSSHHSVRSEPMMRDLSGGSSSSGSSQIEGMTTMSAPGGQPQLRKRRTRALMTHIQQTGLARLWKRTKFPTGAEREHLGQEIGLTPRQVQVWFQNQRQKGRKTLMANGGVPDGEDPADYEDLQKSPRSRRLSAEQEEPVSTWAGSSSSSASTLWPGPLVDPPPTMSALGFEPTSGHPSASDEKRRHAKGVPRPAISSRTKPRSIRPSCSRSRSPERVRRVYFGTVHHAAAFSHSLPPEPPHAVLSSRASSPTYERWEKIDQQPRSEPSIAKKQKEPEISFYSQQEESPFRYRSQHTQPHSNQAKSPSWDGRVAPYVPPSSSSSRPPTGAPLSPPRTTEAYNEPTSSSWQPRRWSPSVDHHAQRISTFDAVPGMMRSQSSTGKSTHLPPTLAKMALDRPVDRGVARGEDDLPSIAREGPISPDATFDMPYKRREETDRRDHKRERESTARGGPASLSSLLD